MKSNAAAFRSRGALNPSLVRLSAMMLQAMLLQRTTGKLSVMLMREPFMPVRPMTGRWRPPSTSQSFRKEKESGKLCIKRWKDSFPGSIS